MQNLLQGKKIIIFGVANERSLAWAIAKEFKSQGAHIALSYMGPAIQKRVEPLANELGADFIFKMDASQDQDYKELKTTIGQKWPQIDGIVHSIAFASKESLKNNFIQTSAMALSQTCQISAFSLVNLTHALENFLTPHSSIITMTYYGSQKVIPNYNAMGVAKAALETSVRYLANDLGERQIRVNCISAGPIKTLAASGISGFRALLSEAEKKAPLKRNTHPNDVAKTATYLASDLSSGVTGQTLYVDCGLSIMGNT